MRSRSKRREIRELARKATEKAHGGQARETASAAPPPAVHEMACLCGQLLRVKGTLDDTRCGCPACGRKFLATFAPDPTTGKEILCPVYLGDSKEAAGDTFIVEAAPKSPTAPAGGGALDEALEPNPPPNLSFTCPCGLKLSARKELYDKRAKCPKCGARMLLSLSYDSQEKRFTLNVVRITDAPSGDTWIAGNE